MSHVVGIDTSTTATKALLIDSAGRVVSKGSASYDFDIPRPMWTEQHPSLWWDATVSAIRAVLDDSGIDPSAIDGIGLTGQMHGSVLLDEAGDVVRPAILWNDQRTQAECEQIRERVGVDRLISITGNDALTGFTAPKLLWVQRHEPEAWERTVTILLPKDYVRYRLTGGRAVDAAGGSGTILFDLARRTWSKEILDALDIDPGLCPPVFEGPETTGSVSAEAAAITGLLEGTPVVAGGGDQSANAVGVGATGPGVVALSLGTSGVVFAASETPSIEPKGRVHAFCHAVPGRWHMMGVMLSAAGSLRWLRDAVAPDSSFEELVAGAAEARAGADGLIFLPYLSGERTPHPDPNARGAFVGLTVGHDLRHMTRAVLEGVAFGLRDGLDLMTSAGVARPDSIRASGGGTRSSLWRQILADVLEAEIAMVATEEGAAYGAGLLALVGTGQYPSVDAAAEQLVSVEPVATPGPDVTVYQGVHDVFGGLYPALKPSFDQMAQVSA
ncbi:MAG TPA: xylulokinase [Acidimicrobiia bacterium]|nr:xylulokinase [Acidimicrobiia bacterium]